MHVTLPDGTQLELPDGASGLDAAAAIGPRLAKAAAAVEVDGELRDLRLPLPDGASLKILTVGEAGARPRPARAPPRSPLRPSPHAPPPPPASLPPPPKSFRSGPPSTTASTTTS